MISQYFTRYGADELKKKAEADKTKSKSRQHLVPQSASFSLGRWWIPDKLAPIGHNLWSGRPPNEDDNDASKIEEQSYDGEHGEECVRERE